MMEWDNIRFFLAVARTGTLTVAAEHLQYSVSTLHRKINSYEEEIGAKLFRKGPKGYQLTHAGEMLLPYAEEIEETVLAATKQIVGHDNEARGQVRVTLPLGLMPILVPYLVEFSNQCKGIQTILQADDLILNLERETDIALRMTSNPNPSAVGRRLCDIVWCLYTSGSPSANLPWVHYVGLDQTPAVQWRKRIHGQIQPMMQVQNVPGMYAVLGNIEALGLLPCFIGDPDPRLTRMSEPFPDQHHQLWLLIHAELRRAARIRAVVDFIVPKLLQHQDLFEGRGITS